MTLAHIIDDLESLIKDARDRDEEEWVEDLKPIFAALKELWVKHPEI